MRSSKGPEAGVWVIAETKDLPTPYVKIVVTDDQGRYLLPDLPKANYSVFVRGYGLVDSPRVSATPGKALNLTAVIAPNEHAAAQYYPAGHWLSMLRIPEAGEFPGTGPQGNGINPNVKSQAEWVRMIKSGGCTACHQLGTKGTREIPKELGTFPSLSHAWERRLASGQAGGTDDQRPQQSRQGARAAAVRGLDRSHQPRRGAAGAAASARRRAQRRDHDVGLGRSEGVSARRGVDGSPQPDAERERPALWRARAERRLRAGARSEDRTRSARFR